LEEIDKYRRACWHPSIQGVLYEKEEVSFIESPLILVITVSELYIDLDELKGEATPWFTPMATLESSPLALSLLYSSKTEPKKENYYIQPLRNVWKIHDLPSSSWIRLMTPSTLDVPFSTATAFLVAATMVRLRRLLLLAIIGTWLTRTATPWNPDFEAATVGVTRDDDNAIAVAAMIKTYISQAMSEINV
jgi:hypothetical protein